MSTLVGPDRWIPLSVAGFIGLIINSMILKWEYQTRTSTSTIFTSKSARIYSMGCLIFGVIHSFTACTQFFDGFCFINDRLWSVMLSIQGIFLGYYQLTRLQYCFSQSNVYSNKGEFCNIQIGESKV